MADSIYRHGGGSHFMRPDRVYRTSVLSPMMGYQPQADVQAVAYEFTAGPQMGQTLQGLGAWPGPIQRTWARFKAWLAERKAAQMMSVATGPTASPPFVPSGAVSGFGYPQARALNGLGMPGPAAGMALQIAPHLATQMTGVIALAQNRYGQGFPAASATALVERPIGRWYR